MKSSCVLLCALFLGLPNIKPSSAETVPDFIKSQGYPVQKHFVTTKDGFILGLHRIPSGGRKAPTTHNGTKPVVLLQHGFATTSDCWVLSGPQNALGFILADKGYDVWLGNSRGNMYSFNHTKLNLTNPKDLAKFNLYSFQQTGTEDLPATIDYILRNTTQKKLSLYAHSEGAAMFFAMGARKHEYLNKINVFFGFAPMVFIGNATSPIANIAGILNKFYLLDIAYTLIKPFTEIVIGIFNFLSSNFLTKGFATIPFTYFSGTAPGQLDHVISRLYKNFPNFVSKRQLTHLVQLSNTKNAFREYEYFFLSFKKIFQIFGPKKYNLKKIITPTFLYFSDGDLFVNYRNMRFFNNTLGKKPEMFLLKNQFGHYDFVYGNDAHNVYNMTYSELKIHSK